jgi:hypothetical protein
VINLKGSAGRTATQTRRVLIQLVRRPLLLLLRSILRNHSHTTLSSLPLHRRRARTRMIHRVPLLRRIL